MLPSVLLQRTVGDTPPEDRRYTGHLGQRSVYIIAVESPPSPSPAGIPPAILVQTADIVFVASGQTTRRPQRPLRP
jgi:hypothetical protein